jgi:hypothetical protein
VGGIRGERKGVKATRGIGHGSSVAGALIASTKGAKRTINRCSKPSHNSAVLDGVSMFLYDPLVGKRGSLHVD